MKTPRDVIMRKIRWKLTRVITLHETACGYEQYVRRAIKERFELEDMIWDAMDKMQGNGSGKEGV